MLELIVLGRLFRRRNQGDGQKSWDLVDPAKLPEHVAVIMDGNGRWAERRGFPRSVGHRAGVEALRKIVEASCNLGIPYLTVYAFSTENWKRPREEVDFLMRLLLEYLGRELEELRRKGIRLWVLGDAERLPAEVQLRVREAIERTRHNHGMQLNVAINYGGRWEITHAAKELLRRCLAGEISPEEVTEDVFADHLLTKGIPDPDLLIRTAGELRLSNFLLWQVAYSEFWSTSTLWPDFGEEEFMQAIIAYQNRQRRFGAISP